MRPPGASIFSLYHSRHEAKKSVNQTNFTEFIPLPKETELVVDNVKVEPAFMIFEDAYDGKQYSQKLTLRNNGRNSAFVRILPPNSRAFKITTLERGMQLCPGLSIVRTIKYTYNIGNAEVTSLPLVINEQEIDYNLRVKLSAPVISVEPDLVDFGEFATWQSPEVRTVCLKNTGSRRALFAIDLGSNELDLLVEPRKGVVSAKSQVILHIEMMGTKRGHFLQEFWVKCVTPVRVQVSVTFVELALLSYHPYILTDFTLVDFPRTYFGTKIMKTMVLINKSPIPSMYCTKVLIKTDVVDMKLAEELGDDIRCFKVWPEQGRMVANECRICEVVYTPMKTKKIRKREKFSNYAISFIQIERVSWKDAGKNIFEGSYCIADEKQKNMDTDPSGSITNTSLEDISDACRNTSLLSAIEELSIPSLSYMKSVTHIESIDVQQLVRICFYGEGETANVTLRPDAFCLGNLEANQTTQRELLIFNHSEVLPIIFKYKKMPFVEVFPKEGIILSEEGKEVLVKVTPGRSGVIKTQIVFELLYYNFPRKEGEYVVVGSESASLEFEVAFKNFTPLSKPKRGMCGKRNLITEDIRFTSKVHIPKSIMPIGGRKKYPNDNAFIAFPDDRPSAMRPWTRTEDIKTMFARIPRIRCLDRKYALTASEGHLRQRNRDYYEKYTRAEAEKLKALYQNMCKKVSDYDITNSKKTLLTNFRPRGYKIEKQTVPLKKPSFTPLTPCELNKISVSPFMIQLEGIVPESYANTTIIMKNNNEFSVRIYINPRRKGVVQFPEGDRKVIKANAEEHIGIIYKAENIGKHYVAMDIVVNESHAYECILQARVIPGIVTTDVKTIEFLSNGAPRKYIKLTNPCNAAVTFSWENNTQSLSILPQKGTVPARSSMYSKILYIPVISEQLASEIILFSDRKSKVLIDVFATLVKPKVGLSTDHLEIPLVPLNIPVKRRIILRNFGNENVLFKVVNATPIPGITVTPPEGILRGCGDQIFSVSICIPACITFSCIVQIEVQKLERIQFKISGTVEYPQIVVKPNSLNLRKVYLGCFDKFKFQIANKGKCVASIKFNFEYYPEFYVSTMPLKGSPAINNKEGLVLKPDEQKVLYLHFFPIDVAPNCFYLPIIVNNILGPSSKIRIDTLLTNTFLGPGANLYKPEFATVTEYPIKLHCTEISNIVSCAILEFSELKFEFYKYTHLQFKSVTSLNFSIKNVSQAVVSLSIHPTDSSPFSINHLEGGDILYGKKNIMTITLSSQDEIILNVVFSPINLEEHTAYFPIYLDGMEDEPYNYIVMHGKLYTPRIEVPNSVVYMLPVPLGVLCESHFTADLHYHNRTCVFSNKSSTPELLISAYREKQVYVENRFDDLEKLHVCVFHTASVAVEYVGTVILECSCGASTTFTVRGAVDHCILTTHIFRNVYCAREVEHSDSILTGLSAPVWMRSDQSIRSDTFSCIFPVGPDDQRLDCSNCPFPMFPTENEPTYLKYMYKCLRTLELYVHKQCFYGKRFYKIPDDICSFPVEVDAKNNPKKQLIRKQKKQDELLYLQILGVLAGAEVLKKMKPQGDYPADELQKITYARSIYCNVIEHLTSKRGVLSHIKPEHLLQYDDYMSYMKKDPLTESIVCDEETFFRYSAQSWIDLLLQTFKVYVLPNVKLPKRISNTCITIDENEKDVRKKLETIVINWQRIAEMSEEEMEINIYGRNEVILLAWFRFIFYEYHPLLFEHDWLCRKRFTNFRDDFLDFLALIVLTAVYCPYLYNDLKDVYVPPKTYEQAFHNACTVIIAWNKVRISYHINPTELIVANETQLVLLSAYLYQVLPTLRPSDTIIMEAPLSKETKKQIPIKNTISATVSYQVLFFENEKGYFSANTESIVIGPKRTGSVTITFFARRVQKTRCVLLLSGETPGYKYAKNLAYYIEGVPNISYYDEINHKLYTPFLYEHLTEIVHIYSPYKVAATYDIFVHHHVPSDASEIYKYKTVKAAFIPRMIYNPNNQIHCDKDGHATTHSTICTMSTFNADFYVYFFNEEIGDFCMRLRVEPKKKRKNQFEVITVPLPRGFLDFPCYCSDSELFNLNCPKTLFALIPCRNNIMWDCMQRMSVKTLGEEQFHFWKKYLGTPTGSHLLHRIMQSNKDETPIFIKHTFNETVEYDVDLDSDYKDEVTLIPDMIIDDVRSADRMEFPIHINSLSTPHSFFCTLKSKDGMEYRFYKMNFVSDAFMVTTIDNLDEEKEVDE